MRLLLTGATGFVGRALLAHLLARGHHVHILSRKPNALAEISEVTEFPGNLASPATIADAAQGCAAVIHLVGIIRESPRNRATFQSVHVEGTLAVLDACRSASVQRYIHMSALGTRENATSAYHQTKFAAEQLVRQSPLAYTIFRPGMILEPRLQPPRSTAAPEPSSPTHSAPAADLTTQPNHTVGASADAYPNPTRQADYRTNSFLQPTPGEFTRLVQGWSTTSAPPYFFFPYFRQGLLGLGPHSVLAPIPLPAVVRAFADALTLPASAHKTYDLATPDRLTWPELYRLIATTQGFKQKPALPIPAWYAKLLTHLLPPSLLPFNLSQVQMATEDNVPTATESDFAKDFGWTLQLHS